jgi:hypothetical protein
VLGDVRLRGCGDERVRRIVEVAARHRGARAFSQVVEVVEHVGRPC